LSRSLVGRPAGREREREKKRLAAVGGGGFL
jgi:hypothetical protein